MEIDFVNFLAELRDLCNEHLERMSPENSYNPEAVPWQRVEGTKGPYERYPLQGPPEQTPDYQGLIADLRDHSGKMQRSGLFYWLFDDGTTIGRKPALK